MYDVIVVGARCAGSATAMLLARKGYSVLLVDKAGFPSDTLSTHYIHQPGVAALERWGLLERVAGSGCPPIRTQVFDVGPFALVGDPPPAGGVTTGYAPRRFVLDQILLEAAVEAGVEVRERFAVKELLREGDRVAGVRGRSEGGASSDERARLVVGADGMRSVVARLAGAATYDERPAASCAYYTYWSGVPTRNVELYPRPDRMLIAAPTNDQLTITIAYWPQGSFDEVRSDVERHFLDALDLVPTLAERVRAGTRAEKIRGSGDLGGFFRKPYGAGWALVGDAGYHKNPITAQGITDAFKAAELLVAAMDDAFSGRRAEPDALAAYESERNAAAMPMYELTAELATLSPPSEDLQKLMFAIRDDPEQCGRFLGTIAGTVSIAEFFSPQNVGRIAGASSQA